MRTICFFLSISLLVSCTERAAYEEDITTYDAVEATAEAVEAADASASPTLSKSMGYDEDKSYDRKIIKNARLSFESSNPTEKILFITNLVSKSKGYVMSNNQSKYDNYTEHNIHFKLPFGEFDAVLPIIEKNCGQLLSRHISSDDVTEEFYDNESRIKAKKELEIRYLELVRQAKSIKDMLDIEEKLSDVRTDIERLQGRQRFLNNNTKFSTFEISIVDKQSTVSNNYFSKVWNSFRNGFDSFFNFILWIIEFIPFILIGWGLYYLIRKKKFKFNLFKKKKD